MIHTSDLMKMKMIMIIVIYDRVHIHYIGDKPNVPTFTYKIIESHKAYTFGVALHADGKWCKQCNLQYIW